MRKTITSAAIAAAAAAVIGGTGIAVAGTHSATSGTENFQLMTTSATSPNGSIIASGVFTAPGVDHEGKHNTATFTFPSGTVSLKHSAGKGTQSFNPKTCLLTVNEHGTYTLTGGTGSYAGITGSGKYQLSILGIAARNSKGKCSMSKPPLAFHQVINASGPVSLP
jgi:hypothetical protein